MALRKKMRANDLARIALTPDILMTRGACSRLEPRPKLDPPHDEISGMDLFGEIGVGILHYVLGQFGQVAAQVGVFAGYDQIGRNVISELERLAFQNEISH